MGDFLLLVNPTAAAGRAKREYVEVAAGLESAGLAFQVELTQGPGHATELARAALREGADGVAVMGGDGTMSEALHGFFDVDGAVVRPGAWLGPMPCGTGGDFRKTIGAKRAGPADLARRLIAARPRPLDVGWIEYTTHEGQTRAQPFLNIASFGLGGLVDQLVNAGPKHIGGTAAFLWATVRAMSRFRGQWVSISVDGGPAKQRHISNVAVANGQYFGGGMHIAPRASIDDGVLDIVTLDHVPIRTQVRLAPALYGGRILEQEGVHFERGRKITALPVGDGHVLLDVDGEAPGRLPATFGLRCGEVRLR